MLRLFRKEKAAAPVVTAVVEPVAEPVITSEIIKEDIHKSFKELLEEMDITTSRENDISILREKLKSFKEENLNLYEKISQLEEFGFINTPSITKIKVELVDREAAVNIEIKALEDRISYVEQNNAYQELYAVKYPAYKFIGKDTMIEIMKKYDIFLGETMMYNREIPDRALGLIGNFKSEIIKEVIEIRYLKGWGEHLYIIRTKDEYNNIEDSKWGLFSSIEISNLKMVAPLSHFNHIKIDDTNVTMFDQDHMVKFNTNKLQEKINAKEALDPIACLEVDGGYIIIDAWDKEADIPEIKNTLIN